MIEPAMLETKPSARVPRADGVEARARLLHTAVHLFAEKGFANTSTRELATAAGVNIADQLLLWRQSGAVSRCIYRADGRLRRDE